MEKPNGPMRDMSEGPEELRCLLERAQRERAFDFWGYKETTLTRRLGRQLREEAKGEVN